jgi:deoxyadenosine/deoxycytidine kinase
MRAERQLYISISGNTSSGKSSLLRALRGEAFFRRKRFEFVDENSLHHQFLPYLFHSPKTFGFQLQLNFMLQRHLIVRDTLERGKNLIMERCHWDDRVFIDHLYARKLVTSSEYRAYLQLWECLDRRLRQPDVIIYFPVPAAVSLKRLAQAEINGERPKEFASETQKRDWVSSWARLYKQHWKQRLNQKSNVELLEVSPNSRPEALVRQVKQLLAQLEGECDVHTRK